jgi:hypothetical protein
MTNEYLDRPPAGWFALDLMKAGSGRKWDWCALMIDVHPGELDPPPSRGQAPARHVWVRIPGKHRTKVAAWDALEDMIATRH